MRGRSPGSKAAIAADRITGRSSCGAELFQPRGVVDGGADHGEVEPPAGADIAEHDLADMQREAEAHRRARRRGAVPVQHRDRIGWAAAAACAARAAVAGALGGEAMGSIASMPSPMNFRISPPASVTAAAHGAEIVVEQGDDGVARQACRTRG